MNSGRLDYSDDFALLLQGHVLACLMGDQRLEWKAAVQADAHDRTFALQRTDASDQMIAGAGLRGAATSSQRPIYPVEAAIRFVVGPAVVGGRREGDKLLVSHLDGCEAIRNLHDFALLDGVYANDARNIEVGRRGEHLLH